MTRKNLGICWTVSERIINWYKVSLKSLYISLGSRYDHTQKSTTLAYVLWLLSGFGWLGLHRLYLNKPKTALVWTCTVGFFGIGAVLDLFAIPWLVKRYNLIEKIKSLNKHLNKLTREKEKLIFYQRFEEAAIVRIKEKDLMLEIGILEKQLRNTDIT